VLTGYRDRAGLRVTLIDLDGTPRIAGSVRLDGRFESEGRSHAFNSMVEPNGGGLLGVPTVPRVRDTGRYPWRSRASDLSYLEMSREGDLAALGELRSTVRDDGDDDDGNPAYECEVSCIDWYGNSRPIFTGGRIFGLTGIELIEGFVTGGRVRELRRLNLTDPVPGR
jgi:hypothetical protein